jgi:hypothetical protein
MFVTPLLRSASQCWNLLRELENGRGTVFTLFSKAESSTVNVKIGEATDSDHIDITRKLAEKEPALALDLRVLMLRGHFHILAETATSRVTSSRALGLRIPQLPAPCSTVVR